MSTNERHDTLESGSRTHTPFLGLLRPMGPVSASTGGSAEPDSANHDQQSHSMIENMDANTHDGQHSHGESHQSSVSRRLKKISTIFAKPKVKKDLEHNEEAPMPKYSAKTSGEKKKKKRKKKKEREQEQQEGGEERPPRTEAEAKKKKKSKAERKAEKKARKRAEKEADAAAAAAAAKKKFAAAANFKKKKEEEQAAAAAAQPSPARSAHQPSHEEDEMPILPELPSRMKMYIRSQREKEEEEESETSGDYEECYTAPARMQDLLVDAQSPSAGYRLATAVAEVSAMVRSPVEEEPQPVVSILSQPTPIIANARRDKKMEAHPNAPPIPNEVTPHWDETVESLMMDESVGGADSLQESACMRIHELRKQMDREKKLTFNCCSLDQFWETICFDEPIPEFRCTEDIPEFRCTEDNTTTEDSVVTQSNPTETRTTAWAKSVLADSMLARTAAQQPVAEDNAVSASAVAEEAKEAPKPQGKAAREDMRRLRSEESSKTGIEANKKMMPTLMSMTSTGVPQPPPVTAPMAAPVQKAKAPPEIPRGASNASSAPQIMVNPPTGAPSPPQADRPSFPDVLSISSKDDPKTMQEKLRILEAKVAAALKERTGELSEAVEDFVATPAVVDEPPVADEEESGTMDLDSEMPSEYQDEGILILHPNQSCSMLTNEESAAYTEAKTASVMASTADPFAELESKEASSRAATSAASKASSRKSGSKASSRKVETTPSRQCSVGLQAAPSLDEPSKASRSGSKASSRKVETTPSHQCSVGLQAAPSLDEPSKASSRRASSRSSGQKPVEGQTASEGDRSASTEIRSKESQAAPSLDEPSKASSRRASSRSSGQKPVEGQTASEGDRSASTEIRSNENVSVLLRAASRSSRHGSLKPTANRESKAGSTTAAPKKDAPMRVESRDQAVSRVRDAISRDSIARDSRVIDSVTRDHPSVMGMLSMNSSVSDVLKAARGGTSPRGATSPLQAHDFLHNRKERQFREMERMKIKRRHFKNMQRERGRDEIERARLNQALSCGSDLSEKSCKLTDKISAARIEAAAGARSFDSNKSTKSLNTMINDALNRADRAIDYVLVNYEDE